MCCEFKSQRRLFYLPWMNLTIARRRETLKFRVVSLPHVIGLFEDFYLGL